MDLLQWLAEGLQGRRPLIAFALRLKLKISVANEIQDRETDGWSSWVGCRGCILLQQPGKLEAFIRGPKRGQPCLHLSYPAWEREAQNANAQKNLQTS